MTVNAAFIEVGSNVTINLPAHDAVGARTVTIYNVMCDLTITYTNYTLQVSGASRILTVYNTWQNQGVSGSFPTPMSHNVGSAAITKAFTYILAYAQGYAAPINYSQYSDSSGTHNLVEGTNTFTGSSATILAPGSIVYDSKTVTPPAVTIGHGDTFRVDNTGGSGYDPSTGHGGWGWSFVVAKNNTTLYSEGNSHSN